MNATIEELTHLLPHFSWVLRDFSSSFKTMDAEAYMHHCLSADKELSDEISNANAIRASLKKHFKHLSCFQLPQKGD